MVIYRADNKSFTMLGKTLNFLFIKSTKFNHSLPFICNSFHKKTCTKNVNLLHKCALGKNYSTYSDMFLSYPANTLLLKEKYYVSNICNFFSIRFKSSKSGRNKNRVEEDSDEESSDEEEWILEKGKNFKDIKVKIPSLRLDSVLKAGLGLSRSKVEENFYSGKIKINRSKPNKKSVMIRQGDCLDFVKESSSSVEGLEIARVKVIKIGEYDEGSDRFVVLMRKYPKLLPEHLNKEENE